MAKKYGSKMHGPLCTPMQPYTFKGTLSPPTGANTTIPGTAPKAAPIQSPLATTVVVGARRVTGQK